MSYLRKTKLFSYLAKNEYAKNFSVLLSGNVFAQIIPLLIAPIISRLYEIDDFAVLALILGISSLISIGSTLQYESAIVLAEDENEAAALVTLSLILIILTTTFSFLVIPFNSYISKLLQSNELESKLFVIPIIVFLTSTFRVFNFWAIRKKMFKALALRQIGQSSSQSITKVVLGISGFTNWGLILGTIIGFISSTGVLAFQSLKNDFFLIISSLNLKKLQSVVVKYKNFPFYSLPHGYGDVLMKDGVIFLVSSFYGSTVLGLYSFSTSILKKPIGLIGSSLRMVFYKRAVELKSDYSKLWSFTSKNILIQSIVALIIFLPIILYGDKLFSFFFGEKWLTAGDYSKYMAFWIIYIFIMTPFSSLSLVLDKQKQFLIISSSLNIIILAVIYYGAHFGFDFTISLLSISVVTFIYFICIIGWLRYLMVSKNAK